MKATNITASRPAATFSARRRSQGPAPRRFTATLLQGVDFLEQPLGPLLRLVGSQVDLLRVCPERVLGTRAEGLPGFRRGEGVAQGVARENQRPEVASR